MPAIAKKTAKKQKTASSGLSTSASVSNSEDIPSIDLDGSLKIESAKSLETQSSDEEIPIERKNNLLYLAGIISLVITVIVLALIYLFWRKESALPKQAEIVASPTPGIPTIIPFAPSDWSLEVLNGSGTAGVAKKAADTLSSLGFKITAAGNADKSNYRNISVYLSADLSKLAPQFMEKIKSVYKDATVAGILETSSPSARIIIGR